MAPQVEGSYREQKNKFSPSVFSRCRYSSGSMVLNSCWSVDSCFFNPLWSQSKFCFCKMYVCSISRGRITNNPTHYPIHRPHKAPECQRLVRTSDTHTQGRAEVRHTLHVPFAPYKSALTLSPTIEAKDDAPKSFS